MTLVAVVSVMPALCSAVASSGRAAPVTWHLSSRDGTISGTRQDGHRGLVALACLKIRAFVLVLDVLTLSRRLAALRLRPVVREGRGGAVPRAVGLFGWNLWACTWIVFWMQLTAGLILDPPGSGIVFVPVGDSGQGASTVGDDDDLGYCSFIYSVQGFRDYQQSGLHGR